MNFGQNLYNWFLSNAQSLVLMAIVVIGVYLGFKREFSKLIGFLVLNRKFSTKKIIQKLQIKKTNGLRKMPFQTALHQP